jgi:hypothetical protein
MFGDVEHGDAAALGSGEVVHGFQPCYWSLCRLAMKPVSGDMIHEAASSQCSRKALGEADER